MSIMFKHNLGPHLRTTHRKSTTFWVLLEHPSSPQHPHKLIPLQIGTRKLRKKEKKTNPVHGFCLSTDRNRKLPFWPHPEPHSSPHPHHPLTPDQIRPRNHQKRGKHSTQGHGFHLPPDRTRKLPFGPPGSTLVCSCAPLNISLIRLFVCPREPPATSSCSHSRVSRRQLAVKTSREPNSCRNLLFLFRWLQEQKIPAYCQLSPDLQQSLLQLLMATVERLRLQVLRMLSEL